jgi:hypothetical protein
VSFQFPTFVLASLFIAYGVVVYVHLFCISTVRTYHDDLKNSFIYLKKSFILMVVHDLLCVLHLTTYHVLGSMVITYHDELMVLRCLL